MKKRLKRISAFVLSAVMAFSMVLVSTDGAFAASGWEMYIGYGEDGNVYVGQEASPFIWNPSKGKDAIITKVKSNNSSVLKANKDTYKDEKGKKHTYYYLTAKKTGKAVVTVNYKASKNGKVKTMKKTVKVLPYPKHIKSLKVNGKKVKIKGDNRYWYSKKWKKTSAKINLKLNKGWKVSYVYGSCYDSKSDTSKQIKGIKKKILNGQKIDFPKKYDNLSVHVEMQKGKEVIYYNINLWR